MENQDSSPDVERKPDKRDAIRLKIDEARQHFAKTEVINSVNKQAQTTLSWMRENEQSYSAEGNLCENKPWWPVPDKTSCGVLKVTRKRVLLDRAYEHGILHFLRGLEKSKTLCKQPLVDRVLNTVLGAMTPVVLNELVTRRYSKKMSEGVSLSELSVLFGNGQTTSPAKVRDKYLEDLSSIGLFSSRENQGYAISVGLTGEIFYTKIFAPIVDTTDINYAEAEAPAD